MGMDALNSSNNNNNNNNTTNSNNNDHNCEPIHLSHLHEHV
jgi:hypothetical protein